MVKLTENNFINPRYVVTDNIEKLEFHGFIDVFRKAHVVAIYIKCLFITAQFSSKLLYNKTRVPPRPIVNPITITRRVLTTALRLTRLVKKLIPVHRELPTSIDSEYERELNIDSVI